MVKPRKGNRNLIKAMNYNLVLNIVRQQGPLSRTQLTEISGLSVGAVSQISNELLNDNWLISNGESEYTGGRRREMLRFNPHAGNVIGIKLMENRIACVITDLEANIIYHSDSGLPEEHSPTAISLTLVEMVHQAIQHAKLPPQTIKGMGIGLAGVIDYEAGVVHYSPYFQWRDIPFAKLIRQYFTFPVYLENDVNTLTIAEQLFGEGHDAEDFVVVTLGRGVGMGMVFNYQLYKGSRGGVGEFGHITMEINGPVCGCGKRGCLESLISDPSIIRQVEQELTQYPDTHLETPVTLPVIRQAATDGDRLAQKILTRSGEYLGIALATVINLLRPALIVLSGEGVTEGDFRLGAMSRAIREHTFDSLLDGIEIVVKPTDEFTWARGAASLVVGKLLESPLVLDQH